MSAKNSISPSRFGTGQLPMFVEAGFLKSNAIGHSDAKLYDEDDDRMWDTKLEEASVTGSSESAHFPWQGGDAPSLVDSVKSHGVREPVVVDVAGSKHLGIEGPYLFDGHHRVATVSKDNPDTLVPVSFIDTAPKYPSGVIVEHK